MIWVISYGQPSNVDGAALLQLGHLLTQLGDVFPHLAVQHPSLDAADHCLTGRHRRVALRRRIQCNRQQPISNSWASADELVVGARQASFTFSLT